MLERVETELFIGGKWIPASSGDRFDVIDPATAAVIASVADGGESDAAAAVDGGGAAAPADEAAAAGGPGWAPPPPRQRGETLRRAFELMTARADELAKLIS